MIAIQVCTGAKVTHAHIGDKKICHHLERMQISPTRRSAIQIRLECIGNYDFSRGRGGNWLE